MQRTRFIEHAGQRLILLDFSQITDPVQSQREIAIAKEFFAALPREKTQRTLTDVTGSRYNADVVAALKDLAAHNEPYVAAAAVVTTSGLHRVAIMAVSTFSRRTLQAFESRAQALDWLVGQRGNAASVA